MGGDSSLPRACYVAVKLPIAPTISQSCPCCCADLDGWCCAWCSAGTGLRVHSHLLMLEQGASLDYTTLHRGSLSLTGRFACCSYPASSLHVAQCCRAFLLFGHHRLQSMAVHIDVTPPQQHCDGAPCCSLSACSGLCLQWFSCSRSLESKHRVTSAVQAPSHPALPWVAGRRTPAWPLRQHALPIYWPASHMLRIVC